MLTKAFSQCVQNLQRLEHFFLALTLPNRLRILVKSIKFQGKSPAQVGIHVQVALAQNGKPLLAVHEERRSGRGY